MSSSPIHVFFYHKNQGLYPVGTLLVLLVLYLSTVHGEVDSHALSQVSIGASDPNHLGSNGEKRRRQHRGTNLKNQSTLGCQELCSYDA